LIAGIATREAWRDATELALRSVSVGRPSFYDDLLMPRSRRLDLWLTEYIHIMPDAKAILDWVRATALRTLLDSLKNDGHRMQFEAEVLE
jgi:trans-aconitate 2-methyltransferase